MLSNDKRTVQDRPVRGSRSESELPRRYESGEEIARGGMGRVIEAVDRVLGRTVAVKEALVTDPDSLRRFARETRITARLEHPSIVPVYDAGATSDGLPYYVMRKVSGQPLDQLIAARPALDDRLALVPHMLAAAQAISHAHSRGVIHRDLKPTNILVGAFGETVVIDWGLAKVLDEPDDLGAPIDARSSLSTNYGAVLGTPGYMPPEQLAAGEVDKRADVYALGATLYYLLARKSPHEAASGEAMMEAAAAGPPIPVEELAPGVPKELAAIVAKALAYETAARYPDAAGFADDLVQFQAGRLVAAHHYSVGERVRRFIAKHRAPLAVGAIAVAVLGVAIERVIAARLEAATQHHLAEDRQRRLADRELASRIDHAKATIETDPAAALAQLIPLADSDEWRTVRDLAAAARARGIAHVLPAPVPVTQIAVAPDGIHAATVGSDGVVRTYDLRARTITNEQRFVRPVIAYGEELAILDRDALVVGGAVIARDVVKVVASAHGLAWIDRARHVLTRAGKVADDADDVAISEDGAHVAVSNARGLWLDGKQLAEGRAFVMAWSPDATHLAASLGEAVIDVDLATHDTTAYRGETAFGLAYADGALVRLTLAGVRSDRPELVTHGAPDEIPIALALAHESLAVAGLATGQIIVCDGKRSTALAGASRLEKLAADRHSPFVVAVAHGQLLAWNLDDVVGRESVALEMDFSRTVGIPPHTLMAMRYGKPSVLVDLASGAALAGPAVTGLSQIIASPSSRVIAALGDDHVLRELSPVSRQLATDVRAAIYLDDDHLAITTARGLEIDGAVVAPASTQLRAANGLVYAWSGTLVRIDAARRAVAYPHALAATSWTIDPDGSAWIVEGASVIHWRRDGETELHATLPRPAVAVLGVGAERVAIDTVYGGEVVMTQEANHVEPAIDFRSSYGGMIGHEEVAVAVQVVDSGLAAVARAAGGTTLFDLGAGEAWPFGVSSPDVHLSPDGEYAYAFANRLRVWNLGLPTTRAATIAWLKTL